MSNHMRIDIKMATTMFYVLTLLYRAQLAANECITKETLSTTDLWHGYLFEHTLQASESTFSYQISYPASQCCVNLLLYFGDQIANITDNMTCEQREAILAPQNNQIISLQPQYPGCVIITDDTGTDQYMCLGERSFLSASPRTWYAAISRCYSNNDTLTMEYFFNMTNVVGSCDGGTSTETTPPSSSTASKTANLSNQTTISNVERGPVYSAVLLATCIILLMVQLI